MRSLDKIIETLWEDYRVNYDIDGIYNDDEALPSPNHWDESSSSSKVGTRLTADHGSSRLNSRWNHYGYHESRTIRLIHAILDNASRAELLTSPNKYVRNYGKTKYGKDD